jgi:hypothetical protein
MIEISNENEKLEFQGYNSLCKHIGEIEKKKFLETGRRDWTFNVHSPERLSKLYFQAVKLLETFLTLKEQEAYEKGLNLLEICKGDPENPYQVVLTPNINVKEMRKVWCRDYFLEKGYMISERKNG